MKACRGVCLESCCPLISCSRVVCALCCAAAVVVPCVIDAHTWYADIILRREVCDVSMLILAHLPILSLVCDFTRAVIAFRATIAVPPGLYGDLDLYFDDDNISRFWRNCL